MKDDGLMVITLIGENDSGQTPSAEDLAGWADAYGSTHPVLADPDWGVTCSFLDCSRGFGLPTMQLLSPGMEVVGTDTHYGEQQLRSQLQ